ncbi:MAG: hypothetical protein L7F78_27125 [Syntrophales bacterium LBB04]|nr:hypothetical protein [Syntrophales bacterium LBB04]
MRQGKEHEDCGRDVDDDRLGAAEGIINRCCRQRQSQKLVHHNPQHEKALKEAKGGRR